jgi:Gly-Xaa carboxypeptidase
MEKTGLLGHLSRAPRARAWRHWVLAALGLGALWLVLSRGGAASASPPAADELCPLVAKLDPSGVLYSNATLSRILHDAAFRNASAARLAGAVQIPTEIYDDTIDPSAANTTAELYRLEPLWRHYERFHRYLNATFPLAHRHLRVESVNRFGLIYTWQGTTLLAPLMLTAHMDVVPVQRETAARWTHAPFSGHYDGEWLYGRGAADCKNLLVGLLETVELLLAEGRFAPQRTLILAFGYDEELLGRGAAAIARVLLARYGPQLLYAIIDEGNEGTAAIEGLNFVLPATAEKGHLNSVIELYTPGGHSLVPPRHTLIGLMARLVARIEAHPFDPVLTNANPVLSQLQCVAEHSLSVSPALKSAILQAHLNPRANRDVVDYITRHQTRYLVATSQAADLVSGGAKSNALPEHVQVVVNHRIALEELVALTAERVLGHLRHVAHEFGLGVVFDGVEVKAPTPHGYFNYTLSEPLEPLPVSPVDDAVWRTFGGALRYLYEDLVRPGVRHVPAPYVSIGNTDTKSYWHLTNHIYRYSPGLSDSRGVHSVDERIRFDGHLQLVAFFYYYIQVVDQE